MNSFYCINIDKYKFIKKLLTMKFIGKFLIFTGLILLIIGIIFYFFEGKFFYKKLPGDIFIDKDNIKIFIPITTMILLSLFLTLILNLIFKIFK